MNGLALEYVSDFHHVNIRRVCAGTDADLIDLHAAQFFNSLDIVGAVRTCSHRYKRTEIDVDDLIVNCVIVSLKFSPYLSPFLCLKEGKCYLIRWEYRCCSTQLSAHVCDGSSLRYRQSLYALAAVLYDLADTALYGHSSQNFEDNVLCGDPR